MPASVTESPCGGCTSSMHTWAVSRDATRGVEPPTLAWPDELRVFRRGRPFASNDRTVSNTSSKKGTRRSRVDLPSASPSPPTCRDLGLLPTPPPSPPSPWLSQLEMPLALP